MTKIPRQRSSVQPVRAIALSGTCPSVANRPLVATSHTRALQLQRERGNRALLRITAGPSGIVQRKGGAHGAGPREQREFVRDTAHFFSTSADFYRDEHVSITPQLFDRLINTWYSMIIDRERMIDSSLGGDAALRRELQSSYIAAIRVLLSRGARALGRPEADLYRQNNGRIPPWAWQTPHRLETGISTPIEQSQAADPITGEVSFRIGNVDVTIAPDAVDARVARGAETRITMSPNVQYETETRGRQTHITSFTITLPARVQTFYSARGGAGGPSAYGRGTTAEDQAGAAVTPHSGTLGFHEGNHGLDYVEQLRRQPPPEFRGQRGMTETRFRVEVAAWLRKITAYKNSLDQASLTRTDCVGITIDDFMRQQNPRGRTRAVCPP
jgi:hypothetical protein